MSGVEARIPCEILSGLAEMEHTPVFSAFHGYQKLRVA